MEKRKQRLLSMKAAIFDLDGVISDTNQDHFKIEHEILLEHGINKSIEEITGRFKGVIGKELFGPLFKEHGINSSVEQAVNTKWERLKKRIGEKGVKEIPGASELVKELKNKGFRLAIASSSRRDFVELVLKKLRLREYFDVIASGEEIGKGKGNPDVFLKAAEKLGLQPSECVVIEDSVDGMKSAKSAGFMVVGLVKSDTAKTPAEFNVTSLEQLLNLL